MKKRAIWMTALLLACVAVFAAAQWNGSRPQENLPDIQPPEAETETTPQAPVEDNGPRIPLVGGITKTEDADGITVEIDLSGDMLIWENALHGNGSTDIEWRQIELAFVYRDSDLTEGDAATEETALAVEGISVTIPENWFLDFPGYRKEVGLCYAGFPNGKVTTQRLGTLYFSNDFSEFVIWFHSDYLNATEYGKYACYPAQTREEAVIIANRVMKQRGWEGAIWE